MTCTIHLADINDSKQNEKKMVLTTMNLETTFKLVIIINLNQFKPWASSDVYA